MSSVISKRWLECFGLFRAYYFPFIKYWAQNHGVGHECVFQRGIPVKWWSAESVCHLCLTLEDAHKKELSWHAGVSPISNLYTRVSREAAILGSGWEEFARAVIWWGGRNGRKQSWIDTWQCCDGELEVAAITVVLSNSLLVVFFLLVITLGLNMWGKKPQRRQSPKSADLCINTHYLNMRLSFWFTTGRSWTAKACFVQE